MKKINNKGFSLVELLIAFTIVAIVGVAVYGFMSFSSNSYRTTSNDVGLQYEQQIVVNQIRDYILESSNAIHFDSTENTLYMFAQHEKLEAGTPTDGITVTKLIYSGGAAEGEADPAAEAAPVDTASGVLDVCSKWYADLPDNYKADMASVSTGKLSEGIKDIEFDLSEVEKNKVTFTITFLSGGKEVSSTQVVSLRNSIKNTADKDEIVSAAETEIHEFIDSIKVFRDGVELHGRDTVSKYGDKTVSVQYVAKPQAVNVYSSRVYGVRWELPDGDLDGKISIDSSGRLSVSSDVDSLSMFTIRAVSIDNPYIYCDTLIMIDDNGKYPDRATLYKMSTDVPPNSGFKLVENGNGFTTYKLDPRISPKRADGVYLSTQMWNTSNKDDFIWHVSGDELPASQNGITCGFDPNTCMFTFTSACSGKTVKVYFEARQRGYDGSVIKSNELTFTVPDIDPYTPDAYFNLTAPSSVLRGAPFDASVEWVSDPETDDITYFWKIEPINDGTAGEWSAADQKVKTDFDTVIRPVILKADDPDGSDENFFVYCGTVNSYGDFDEGFNAGDWYWSKYDEGKERKITTNVESFLHWDNAYKFSLMVFAVGNDASGKYVVYDLNGSSHEGQAERKPIKPVQATITIPKVTFTLTPSAYSLSNSYKYRYDGVKDEKYQSFLTDNELYPRVKDYTNKEPMAPGERRIFNYEVDGLYIYGNGRGDLIDAADGRSFSTSYLYSDNGNRVNINVTNKLSPYTVKAGIYSKSSKVDREVYLPDYSQFLIELDVSKKKNNKSTDFETYHPNRMTFQMQLDQKKMIHLLNGNDVEITNQVHSDIIDYHIRYNAMQ